MKHLGGAGEFILASLADVDFVISRQDGSGASKVRLNTGKNLGFNVRASDMSGDLKLQVTGEVNGDGVLELTATDMATLRVVSEEVGHGREVMLQSEPPVRILRS